MVSHFSLQGKSVRAVVIKSRSTSAKAAKTSSTPKKSSKSSRSTSVPVDRKENVIEFVPQPCCSHTSSVASSISIGIQRIKPGLRPNKAANLRNRVKNLKTSNSAEKSNAKSSRTVPVPLNNKQKIKVDITTKLQTTKDSRQSKRSKEENDRVQLREICFIKDNEGKKVIAKYNKTDKEMCEDNLIVAWNAGNANPQVFSQKAPLIPNFLAGKIIDEAGPSKKGMFRVHNFSKNTSFAKTKRNKRNLRRLAGNTDSSGKIDKVKKRKKIKPKVVT